ncbi:MAG: hypothetical protein NDI69_09155 [Bacteriovoracaceae bacterium]|nr:hypothetical protein [Bacteriovoracaceae bacterium]
MSPGFFSAIAKLIVRAELRRSEKEKQARIQEANVVCSIKGDYWGISILWLPIIAISICLCISDLIPTFWRWYLGLSGFFTFPICAMFSIKKDELAISNRYLSGFPHSLISVIFIVIGCFSKSDVMLFEYPSSLSISVSFGTLVLLGFLPFILTYFSKCMNIFHKLAKLEEGNSVAFNQLNAKIIAKRPYLFFYQAIVTNKIILAKEIISIHPLSFSSKVYFDGGSDVARNFTTMLTQAIYLYHPTRWRTFMDFLEPLPLDINSGSVRVVTPQETLADQFLKPDIKIQQARSEMQKFIVNEYKTRNKAEAS